MKKLLLFFVLGATLQVCSKTRDDSKPSDLIPDKLKKNLEYGKQKTIELKNNVITTLKNEERNPYFHMAILASGAFFVAGLAEGFCLFGCGAIVASWIPYGIDRAITRFVKTPDTSTLNTGGENNEKLHTLCRDNCDK